uniref:Ribonuclease A family member 12 (inactive) n=2 Tax=Otolemur garnettii TaxID=30611 RepID=H0WJW1_OTOGA
ARDVKGILPVMIIMVIVFLLLLFWENELSEDAIQVSTLEHLHVDYPHSDIPVRYCNYMIIHRAIRERDRTCKKQHVFIHERPRKINNICVSPKRVACRNHSDILCFQSETMFQMTVCQLTEGTTYPACRYHISPMEGFVLVLCDELGPVKFLG